jgi:hypothetical protein
MENAFLVQKAVFDIFNTLRKIIVHLISQRLKIIYSQFEFINNHWSSLSLIAIDLILTRKYNFHSIEITFLRKFLDLTRFHWENNFLDICLLGKYIIFWLFQVFFYFFVNNNICSLNEHRFLQGNIMLIESNWLVYFLSMLIACFPLPESKDNFLLDYLNNWDIFNEFVETFFHPWIFQ